MQTKTKRPQRTPEEARTFERFSVANAVMAQTILQDSGACKGGCEPYASIFTYGRWQSLGFQVKRGEHGARLPVVVSSTIEDEEGNTVEHRRPWSATVFCRCQVESKNKALSN